MACRVCGPLRPTQQKSRWEARWLTGKLDAGTLASYFCGTACPRWVCITGVKTSPSLRLMARYGILEWCFGEWRGGAALHGKKPDRPHA